MSDPWLTLIGIGEDGLPGLSEASRNALAAAEIIFGGPRHLALAEAGARGHAWPLPFSTAPVLAARGRRAVVLASGDPFWHGAGGSLVADLAPGEWVSHPAPASFALAANRLGWRMEQTACIALHAAPFARLGPLLARGRRLLCTLRDGDAAGELAAWLAPRGTFRLTVMEALGGPRERLRAVDASAFCLTEIAAPALMAVEVLATDGLPRTPGLPDDAFAHDGQITRRAIRALTLCALAPRKDEVLWDIGAGSGSVSVEWCLQGGRALALEPRADRAANVRLNAESFGLAHRLTVIEGAACSGHLPLLMESQPPDAVFVGGGADAALLERLTTLAPGTRLVMNAVTLETEELLTRLHASTGGTLLRIDLATATPLGRMRGWTPARPIVQWSVTL